MKYPIEKVLSENVSGRTRIGYLLVDWSLRILAANEAVSIWSQREDTKIVGNALTDVLPEFIGLEAVLQDILKGRRDAFILPRVRYKLAHDETVYVDMQVEPFMQFGASLLVTLVDVTEQALQEQQLQQQRNELGMLATRLEATRDQLLFVLERFVPKMVAKEIVSTQQLPTLGEIQYCQATILFADMRDFTKVAESYAPNQTLDILNAYLSVIIEAVQKYDGSIVQIVGDMIMATFNVPQTQQDHALRCIEAALYTAKVLKQFAQEIASPNLPKLGFGIGICSGFVTAGYLGASQRYRYAVVGDATNVAFHLCARAAAGQVLAAGSTIEAAGSNPSHTRFKPQFLERALLKRRQESVAIYEIEEG